MGVTRQYYFATSYLHSRSEALDSTRLKKQYGHFTRLEEVDDWYEEALERFRQELLELDIEEDFFCLFEDFMEACEMGEGEAQLLYSTAQQDYYQLKESLIRHEDISEDIKAKYNLGKTPYLKQFKEYLFQEMSQLAVLGSSASTLFAQIYCEIYRYQKLRYRLKNNIFKEKAL